MLWVSRWRRHRLNIFERSMGGLIDLTPNEGLMMCFNLQ